MKYTRLTLTLVVREGEANEVEDLLNQALDAIGTENQIFDDKITQSNARRPKDAEDEDC